MKYLVTGGAGFIGSHIVDRLIEKGESVAVIDNLSSGKKEYVNPKARFYELDILDERCSEIFAKEKPEIVIHFAGHIEARESVKNPVADARANVLGSLTIFEHCKKIGVKKIIFASSGGEVYGQLKRVPASESDNPHPVTPYGVAKLAVEYYLATYKHIAGISWVALRLGNVYGPRQNPKGEAGVVAIFLGNMRENRPCIIHDDGLQTKDYIYVDDVVSGVIAATREGIEGVYNVGTGKETSVLEIFEALTMLTHTLSEKEHQNLPFSQVRRLALDITKAKTEISWQPAASLEEGLKKTVEA